MRFLFVSVETSRSNYAERSCYALPVVEASSEGEAKLPPSRAPKADGCEDVLMLLLPKALIKIFACYALLSF